MTEFIGRNKELKRLKSLLEQKTSKLIVLKGRRRIGKSRILQEFGKEFGRTYVFSGLAPETGIKAEDQRLEFSHQLEKQCHIPGINTDDWSNLFWHLSQHTKEGKTLIILDEISWMAHEDPTFLPKLKNAWDLYFKKNNRLVLALCGSISSWIQKNILSSTAFLGRFSLDMTLTELPINECVDFWDNGGEGVSAFEKLKMLSVTGGVPRYLEEMNPKYSAEKNIQDMCFRSDSILLNEFKKIFSDLFSNRSHIYEEIVTFLVTAHASSDEICDGLNRERGGDIYEYLDDLSQAGFVTRDYTWHIGTGEISKLSKFRLSDNYSRFYLKYISPNANKIKMGNMEDISLSTLPGWSSIMGFQVENLVLNNRKLIKESLDIIPNDIIFDQPFFQRKTTKQQGCQIDYLIQTRFNTLYICEIKFSKNPIDASIIDEVKEKIKRISLPKNFSYRPVLIHCNTVSESVEESGFFTKIINFSEYLS